MADCDTRRPRVVIVQTVVPDYRRRFFDALRDSLGSGFELVAGDHDWEPGIAHANASPAVTRNRFFARRHLLWQHGALRPALTADVVIFDLNPRIVSTWAAMIARRLRGRRSLVWGHAWPRSGRASRTDRIRARMRNLADTVIVYTMREAHELRGEYPRLDVLAAPNALYTRDVIHPTSGARRTDFVCVARLTPTKRPDLLLRAFLSVADRLPQDTRLVFVGDGPLRDELQGTARDAGAADRVQFLGHRSALDELRPIYAGAIASVSPGYAGLSVVQSLGFGVPMIVARDAAHAPEIEAVVEGENAVYFTPSTPEALGGAILEVVSDRDEWATRADAISSSIRDRYSVEVMVATFVDALRSNERRTTRKDPT